MAEIALMMGWALLAMSAVMATGWLLQKQVGDGGWSDVFWTFGTGIVLTACALAPMETLPAPLERRLLIAVLVVSWCLRLGLHILLRVARGPEDARYAQMRRRDGPKFQSAMFGLMIVQAPVSALLAGVVILAAHAPGPLGLTDALAALIFALGVAGETLADRQLTAFKADPAHKGRVCDTGLWGWSRHPNYMFEWIVWFAYPAAALGHGAASPLFWATFAAPGLMYFLLTRVSGVPPLEKAMLESRGEAFRRYQARVPVFLPLPRPPKPTGARS